MKRWTECWFEWKGVRCEEMGVRLMALPSRPIPAVQGEKFEIPGRDGFLFSHRRAARYGIRLIVSCQTADGFSGDALAAWMQGEGLLRFSDEPNRAYRARVMDEFVRENVFLNFDRQRFDIGFECQPHRYLYPSPEVITLTEKGAIVNPGTAQSLPRITIEGTGDMLVWIGGRMLDIQGGSVVVDSEMQDCFEADGVTLANNRVTMDDFPVIPAGECAVSWTGEVERVTVEGRWRYL